MKNEELRMKNYGARQASLFFNLIKIAKREFCTTIFHFSFFIKKPTTPPYGTPPSRRRGLSCTIIYNS
jgi:hypothetical protein